MSGRHEGVQRPIVPGDVVVLPLGSRVSAPILIVAVHPDGRLSGRQDGRPASMPPDIAGDAWIVGHDPEFDAADVSRETFPTTRPLSARLTTLDSFYGRVPGDVLISRVPIGVYGAGTAFEVVDVRSPVRISYGVRAYASPDAAVREVPADQFERN